MIPADWPESTAINSPYRDQPHLWCIICQLPNMQRLVVNRFRRRSHAEESLKILQRVSPEHAYQIIFDPPERLEAPIDLPNSMPDVGVATSTFGVMEIQRSSFDRP